MLNNYFNPTRFIEIEVSVDDILGRALVNMI